MRQAHAPNYAAWEVNPRDFPPNGSQKEQLEFLLNYAVLAPSSHNSQPWRFFVSDDAIGIGIDAQGLLPVCDPTGKLAHIAIGAALENILIAADYFSFATHRVDLPHMSGEEIVRIRFEKKARTEVPSNHLIFSIPRRRVNREAYEPVLLDPDVIRWLQTESSPTVDIRVFQTEEEKKAITEATLELRAKAFSSAPFRKEISQYKRTNITRSVTGMPGFTMGFSTIVSLVAPWAIRWFNIPRLMRRQDEILLTQQTPAYAVLSIRTHSPMMWIDLGQTLERLLLEMERRSLATSIQVMGEPSPSLRAILGSHVLPQLYFRFGRAQKIPKHSPRKESEICTTRV